MERRGLYGAEVRRWTLGHVRFSFRVRKLGASFTHVV